MSEEVKERCANLKEQMKVVWLSLVAVSFL